MSWHFLHVKRLEVCVSFVFFQKVMRDPCMMTRRQTHFCFSASHICLTSHKFQVFLYTQTLTCLCHALFEPGSNYVNHPKQRRIPQ